MANPPGRVVYNASGISPIPLNADSATRNANGQPPLSQDAITSRDNQLQAQASQLKANGDEAGARQAIEQIVDQQTRITTFRQVFPDGGTLQPPGTVYIDGILGISDPLALFFMMVFYVDSFNVSFTWGDVLKAAQASNGGTGFDTLTVQDAYLPQARFDLTHPSPATATVDQKAGSDVAAQRQQLAAVTRDGAASAAAAKQQGQQQADAAAGAVPATTQSANAGVNTVAIWPVQNMPKISDLTKQVNWQTNASAPTMAEPIISQNKGGSPITFDMEFVYAVGIPGMGDGEVADMPPSGENQDRIWTPEDVMGVMYLAESLVYPFKSNNITGKDADESASAKTAASGAAAQYPILFLRHYSLFPFLTPFVVTCVRITPDEEQPLIISQRNRLDGVSTHLTFPAVRQIVKIVLSLQSAHYYLPFLAGKDPGNQMQLQTSGQTYLQIAKQLLGGRI